MHLTSRLIPVVLLISLLLGMPLEGQESPRLTVVKAGREARLAAMC